jgi:hypothetical protein
MVAENTAAAVAHDALVRADTRARKFARRIGERYEVLRGRIDKMRGRDIQTARDTPWPSVPAGFKPWWNWGPNALTITLARSRSATAT